MDQIETESPLARTAPKGKLLIGPGKLEKAKNDLTTAEAELSTSKADLTIAETERDECKRQVEDKRNQLSELRDMYEDRQKEYGKACLWVAGQKCNSRGLTVAVQYVKIEDIELAKKIRGLFAYHLQSRDPLNSKKYPAEHINTPFDNPSREVRIVIFSDSDVGSDVKNAFNRYNLLDEKVANYEKSFAGKLPEVDIAIVVFPAVGKEE